MTIDRYTKEQFEAALPLHKTTGEALWHSLGLDKGEETYSMPVKNGVQIRIRSSVRPDGIAAPAGGDSIRAWLVDDHGKPLGSKIISYTTRKPGWADRMTNVLKQLYGRGLRIPECPYCDRAMGVFKVKKEGPNKGRYFSKCPSHGQTFFWLDEQAAPSPPPPPKAPRFNPYSQDDVVGALAEHKKIKDRVAVLREALSTDADLAIWALNYIYSFQTAAEQSYGQTVEDNGVGFTGVDGEILSSFAEQWVKRNNLTDKQMAVVLKKMGKYAKQIEKSLRDEVVIKRDLAA